MKSKKPDARKRSLRVFDVLISFSSNEKNFLTKMRLNWEVRWDDGDRGKIDHKVHSYDCSG